MKHSGLGCNSSEFTTHFLSVFMMRFGGRWTPYRQNQETAHNTKRKQETLIPQAALAPTMDAGESSWMQRPRRISVAKVRLLTLSPQSRRTQTRVKVIRVLPSTPQLLSSLCSPVTHPHPHWEEHGALTSPHNQFRNGSGSCRFLAFEGRGVRVSTVRPPWLVRL